MLFRSPLGLSPPQPLRRRPLTTPPAGARPSPADPAARPSLSHGAGSKAPPARASHPRPVPLSCRTVSRTPAPHRHAAPLRQSRGPLGLSLPPAAPATALTPRALTAAGHPGDPSPCRVPTTRPRSLARVPCLPPLGCPAPGSYRLRGSPRCSPQTSHDRALHFLHCGALPRFPERRPAGAAAPEADTLGQGGFTIRSSLHRRNTDAIPT